MMPKWHLLWGFVFSYTLIYFFDFSVVTGILIFLSSVLVDIDHVLIYFLETKNIHPKKFWDYSIEKKIQWGKLDHQQRYSYKRPHFILHGIEFIIILILFSFFWKLSFFVFLGILFHLSCDFVILIYEKEHISLKFSQIWLWQRNKNKKDLN
jgi:hypothetical protein